MIIRVQPQLFTISDLDSFKEQYKYIGNVLTFIEQFPPIIRLHILRGL